MNFRTEKFGDNNNMLFDLKNKVAVVTGGGRGIGQAIADVFASQGAQVCIADLNENAAGETAKTLANKNLLAKGFGCDVTKQSDVQSVFESIAKQLGRIDILVNSAG